MTWKMKVREDEPPPPGWYKAESLKVEDADTPFGMRLRWLFWLLEIGVEVSGWTSMSPSTKARAYEWAEILSGGPIDGTWGPETVERKRCWAKVESCKDSKGEIRSKVREIKPLDENPEAGVDFSEVSS